MIMSCIMTIISKIPLLLEMKLFLLLLRSINLECPIHAGAGQVLGVFTKPHSGSHSSVVVHYLQLIPLFTEIDSDIRSSNSKVGTAGVEAEVPHFISILKPECLEILQLPQIPQLDTGIIGSCCQIVTIF